MKTTINNVPLLDLKAQYDTLRKEIEPAVKEVMESQYFIGGPRLKEFENNIAEYCQSKFALGVSSGTDALLLALMALDIEPGDEVIVPVYSFFATAGCVSRIGAKPVFVDIDPETYNIDPQKLESAITPKTKVIIPVHLYGQLANMNAIMDIARKNNLYVIEDAAQAIGSENDKGERAGTFGDIGCFSFFPSKNLGGFGDGGLVTTKDEELFKKMDYLKNHGAYPKYYHKLIGGNFRLDSLQAVVLDIKLKYLDSWTAGRQENAEYYIQEIENRGLTKYITTPFSVDGYRHIYNQFILKCENRDGLIKHLRELNVGCEIYYPVTFNNQECFTYLGYEKGTFPVAENAADSTIAIPVYPELTDEQKNYILDGIEEFYK
ncbi:MAG: DegT/DnrJ/EryC1/StrS family aminotransferase [Calditrichaeota bacterium]|nr:MAG: DegT/DnrJ/EryC1/StrS family aminotransferase [Calditrichota bacterium]MBL1205348.1 DegT/DnrJ/EryC1/StrS family aminotransferase [Calditrichota bacterium]NOG45177.1 DegT/DnrJ/EryC1/StrS family aminotransferase [Calditrichota bacterium]